MKQFTLAELAHLVSARLVGDDKHVITGVNGLQMAKSSDASFLANDRYMEAMKASQAGVICVGNLFPASDGKNFLLSDDPSRTFQKIVELFFSLQDAYSGFSSIHSTAIVHSSAKIAKNIVLGPYAVIDRDVVIGENTFIGSHCYIGPQVVIGKNCIIHPSVVIRERCILQDRVVIQPGCVIGSCGFGYTINDKGKFEKLEQMGSVFIEEDVEIGANTTIDRARFDKTVIGKGSKIDNLVQIAHNVEIGQHNAIAAQTGIAGSSKTGHHVIMGGQVGVTGHVEIGDHVQIAAQTGVSKSHKTSCKLNGTPALEIHQYNRQNVYIRRLEGFSHKIKEIEEKLQNIEKKLS